MRVLPDGRSAAVVTGFGAWTYDLETGSEVGAFAKAGGPYVEIGSTIGAGGAPESATVALVERRSVYPSYAYALSIHEVPGGSAPTLRVSAPLPADPFVLLVDRDGAIVVVGYGLDGPWEGPARYEVRDARTAAVLSVIDVEKGGRVAVLAEGDGARVLVIGDSEGVELFDLEDPSAPAARGRVATRLGFNHYGFVDPWNALAPSRIDPVVFAASPGEHAIVAIDVRDASIAGRSPCAGLPPLSIVIAEDGGRRVGVALASRTEFDEVYALGGRREVHLHDLTEPSAASLTARITRNEPGHVEGFVGLGPDHAVAVEPAYDAYALVSLREGRVVQVTGPPHLLGAADTLERGAWLRSAGRFVLAVGQHRWQEWVLVAGRLEPVTGGGSLLVPAYVAGDVHRSGRVALVGYENRAWFLEVHDPAGRTGRVAIEATKFDSVALSPDGRRAIVTRFSLEPGEGAVTCVDLADPEQPFVAWIGVPGVATARIDPAGETIFATLGYEAGAFTARRFDARTGAPIGGESAPIAKFYYHGDGTAFGSGSGWRDVVWTWTLSGWQTFLLDAGASTPTVLRVYPEILDGIPVYAPRETGGWYEIVRNPWDGYADFLVADAVGEQRHALRDPRDHEFPTSVGRGLFATVARPAGPSPEVVLWRDTTLRRPETTPFPGVPSLRPVAPR